MKNWFHSTYTRVFAGNYVIYDFVILYYFVSLKMSENVMLWQREKARILKDHDEKIRELNKTIKKWEDEVESMKRKLNDQRDDLKMEKMKIDLTKRKALANAPAG